MMLLFFALFQSSFLATESLPLSDGTFNDTWPPISIVDYVKRFGYDLESHDVITEDGYNLTYHRLPCRPPPCDKPPVLLQHGMMAASDVWLMRADALAFMLADAGFDVWLGNARGNSYSRRHIKFDPDNDGLKFWDFSFHEMGCFDLAAGIDHVLTHTGATRLLFVGHSLGTTQLMVLGAIRPGYMNKIQTAVLLAPVANLTHIDNRAGLLINDVFLLVQAVLEKFGRHSFLSYSYEVFWLDKHICANQYLKFLCKYLIFYLFGFDDEEFDEKLMTSLFEYQPSGLSFKTYKHVNQLHKTGFKQYDYGSLTNWFVYGSVQPPKYNLSKVNCPTHVLYTLNDGVVNPQDVLDAVGSLPNVQSLTLVGGEHFNHVDFLWAVHSKSIISEKVLAILLQSVESTNDTSINVK